MIKSVLAASEGGPDAAMSFSLAARVAQVFGATVDALHLPANPTGMTGGMAMGGEAMPLLMDWDDKRLEERAQQSAAAFKDVLSPIAGATYTAAETATLDMLVAMGRSADVLVLGRPGSDPENIAPSTVEAALYECARPVLIAPPQPGSGPIKLGGGVGLERQLPGRPRHELCPTVHGAGEQRHRSRRWLQAG